ncbi:MAG: peptidylprolyl isomerase [Pseudomonadota bacterium]
MRGGQVIERIGAALLAVAMLALPVAAQNPFATAARVNGDAITNYQVDQRLLFLTLLRSPDANRAAARDALINEALQVQAAEEAGIEVTPEELQAGIDEFASRGDLSSDEFVAALGRAGVAEETFRDFVQNGLFWRELVQQRFVSRARPTEEEIERTLLRGGPGSGVRVLLSEIALPITPETEAEARALAQRLSDTIQGEAAFAEAARTYSRSPSAERGGRLDWVPLSNMGGAVAGSVLGLSPGQVSDPVDLGPAVVVFLMRGLEEGAAVAPPALSLDYAEYLIPGGRSPQALAAARALRARVDTCDDLYGAAQRQPERLTRAVAPAAELPADLRRELDMLDENEVSTRLTAGGNLRFVMLCGRVVEPPEGAFEAIGQQLLGRRLESYSEGFLDELRADAIIEIE